jgi:RNA-directed DNA polymerase
VTLQIGADPALLDLMPQNPWRFYRKGHLPKRDGSQRMLWIPHESLMLVQQQLLDRYLAPLVCHPADHCREGRSVITNAWCHVGHSHVSAYDIANCYPKVRPHMVQAALRRAGMTSADAAAVTSLTTYRGELPQGAPTSPALLSIVLRRIDCELSARAARHGLVYSRYMDDLFVSGNNPVAFFEREIRTVIGDAGFTTRRDKRRNWGPAERATLAGVSLAARPTANPEYVGAVGQLIHGMIRSRSAPSRAVIQSLHGKIAWIAQLRPKAARRLRPLLAELEARVINPVAVSNEVAERSRQLAS